MSQLLDRLKRVHYGRGLSLPMIASRIGERATEVAAGVQELIRQGVLEPVPMEFGGCRWMGYRKRNGAA